MLRIFTPVKIQRLRPGLNPQTWVPEANMLTTRPPKPSIYIYIYIYIYGNNVENLYCDINEDLLHPVFGGLFYRWVLFFGEYGAPFFSNVSLGNLEERGLLGDIDIDGSITCSSGM